MIHIQHSTTTKPTSTNLVTKQAMPLPQQAVFSYAAMLARTGLSGRNLLDSGLAFTGLWSDCEHVLSIDSLSTDRLSINSSAYIDRLEPTQYRSGERRRLAAIPL